VSAESQRVAEGNVDLFLLGGQGYEVHFEAALGVGIVEVYRGWDDRFVDDLCAYNQLDGTGGAE